MDNNLVELTNWYKDQVYLEMEKRGYDKNVIPSIVGKTGFLKALSEFPREQLHDSISDAVDEILFVAAAA